MSRNSKQTVRDEEEEERQRVQRKRREEMLGGQKKREEEATEKRVFTKMQRCFYFHKPTETWLDTAQVIGVHLEDCLLYTSPSPRD